MKIEDKLGIEIRDNLDPERIFLKEGKAICPVELADGSGASLEYNGNDMSAIIAGINIAPDMHYRLYNGIKARLEVAYVSLRHTALSMYIDKNLEGVIKEIRNKIKDCKDRGDTVKLRSTTEFKIDCTYTVSIDKLRVIVDGLDVTKMFSEASQIELQEAFRKIAAGMGKLGGS